MDTTDISGRVEQLTSAFWKLQEVGLHTPGTVELITSCTHALSQVHGLQVADEQWTVVEGHMAKLVHSICFKIEVGQESPSITQTVSLWGHLLDERRADAEAQAAYELVACCLALGEKQYALEAIGGGVG